MATALNKNQNGKKFLGNNGRCSPKYDAGNMTMDPRFFELLGSLLFVKKTLHNAR
jgi:hypothetical protein